MIPRAVSYLECLVCLLIWTARHRNGIPFYPENLCISGAFLLVISKLCRAGNIGKADWYMIMSMFLLFSTRSRGVALIAAETLFLCVSFFSAGIRNYAAGKCKGGPFTIHLLCSYVLLELFFYKR
ncbi:hypothetical protein OCV88_12060 [Brotonthovivens ammoniilytica]|uniref:Uncharacterized protein n=1 Tax=Brotonthovivens ammoniilytica TaxID=2981725 RepID=A0ABT2TN04_9FIRM|nr:hypothetical protein [Brotonthovivens ammoniilytica]MCU6763051.1 hypothetical protein [Brotonthovivens ammoniilytica]